MRTHSRVLGNGQISRGREALGTEFPVSPKILGYDSETTKSPNYKRPEASEENSVWTTG